MICQFLVFFINDSIPRLFLAKTYQKTAPNTGTLTKHIFPQKMIDSLEKMAYSL
jgi:hypothetical protein